VFVVWFGLVPALESGSEENCIIYKRVAGEQGISSGVEGVMAGWIEMVGMVGCVIFNTCMI
jgi:hypothetical protein